MKLLRLVCLLGSCVSLLALACGSDPVEPSDPPPAPRDLVVHWEEPLIPAAITDIRGLSDSEVYAVGGSGLLLRYDGNEWKRLASPTHEHFSRMWVLSPDNIVAVGTNGTIVRFDGKTWRSENAGTVNYLTGVWGSAPDTLFAVGYEATVLKFDGHQWGIISGPPSRNLRRIWGTSGDNMYVGASDSLYHFNGSTWTNTRITLRDDIWGITGSSPHDVWVTDCTNWLWHYDGLAWTTVIAQVGYPYSSLWSVGSDCVFGVGTDGFVSHFDGSTWSEHSLGDYFFLSTWGSRADNAWAVGVYTRGSAGVAYQFDGIEWRETSRLVASGLRDIWSKMDGTHAIAVGFDGSIAQKSNTSWRSVDPITTENLNAVWGSETGGAVAVGENGACLKLNGGAWHVVDLGTSDNLSDVWGSSDSDIFISSWGGVLHFDGSNWSRTNFASFSNSIWGDNSTNVFASGADSLFENRIVQQFDGNKWTPIYSSPTEYISGLTGDGSGAVFAVFEDDDTHIGTVKKYDGTTWIDLPALPAPQVSAITATNIGLVVVAHDFSGPVEPGVYRLRNDAWEPVDVQYAAWFSGAWGLDSGVYLVGGASIVRVYH